ncbi:interferon-induced protein 44-like [Melanotaenia boesemani]|uniref:interferon-induced protein 44-like n=1 Tax=Melanotaenia boesemani TaxID=1250792 RepID=UPI001C03B0D9|nr:interferon-induced protein 44-like [Melanotaenia boesemani]
MLLSLRRHQTQTRPDTYVTETLSFSCGGLPPNVHSWYNIKYMGGKSSFLHWMQNPALLSEPWRKLPENDQEILEFIKSYKPRNDRAGHLRILLHGPVGAGKSSFINSVESVVLGRISGQVMTAAASESCFTTKYKTFRIYKDENKTHCSFVFNDMMGLEPQKQGVPEEDLKLALRGHIAEGYKFIPGRPLMEEDPFYNKHPSLDNKIHVLVSVVSATTLNIINDEVVEKMREVRLEASRLEMPQLTIITHVDEACSEVKKDIKNIYKSTYLKNLVERFHQVLGIPLNCIFLVKNYSSEVETSSEMDVQILQPLKQMILFGEDFLKDQED